MRASLLLVLCVLGCGSSDDESPAGDIDSGSVDAATDSSSPSDDTGMTTMDASASDVAPDAPAGRDFSTDRSKFFGESRCASAKVQLCEDFESGTLDKTVWTVNGAPPTVEGTQHARGSKALHIKKDGNGASYIKETKTFPAPKNTYWGRIFVRFEQLPTSPGMSYAHWTFAAASGSDVPGEIRLRARVAPFLVTW